LFGRRWAQRGWLQQAEDFFFLTIPEIQAIIAAGNPATIHLDLLKVIAERRMAFEGWFKIESPEVIDSKGKPLAWQTAKAQKDCLQGLAISGGSVRGVARVILDPREAIQLQPGEILVTRATDVGWTAIFPLISGVVTEIGGQLSHAAILAREYGLPAVVDVPEATRIIRDGQIISLDGATGHVYLEGAQAMLGASKGEAMSMPALET
jgi:pyruvate,water dikinase